MALPHTTPLLVVGIGDPVCRLGPRLFPGPSREGEGGSAGFLPPRAPSRGGAGKPLLLRAQSLEALLAPGLQAVQGSEVLTPASPTP